MRLSRCLTSAPATCGNIVFLAVGKRRQRHLVRRAAARGGENDSGASPPREERVVSEVDVSALLAEVCVEVVCQACVIEEEPGVALVVARHNSRGVMVCREHLS